MTAHHPVPVLDAHTPPRANPASVAATAQAMDLIFIEGFVGQTVIGIHDSELHLPQPIAIDLHAGLPRARACDTDRIGDTIDYSVVHTRLLRLLVEHRLQLLEAFAEAVADILIDEFGAHWVRVKVSKPHKFDNVQAVGVLIERERAPQVPSAAPTVWHGAPVLQLIGNGMVPGEKG